MTAEQNGKQSRNHNRNGNGIILIQGILIQVTMGSGTVSLGDLGSMGRHYGSISKPEKMGDPCLETFGRFPMQAKGYTSVT